MSRCRFRLSLAAVGLIVVMVAARLSPLAWGDDDPAALVARALERTPDDQRSGVARTLNEAGANAPALAGAILEAPDDDQRGAVAFLVAHLPPADRTTLSKAYLLEDVAYAFKARNATAWAKRIPRELFLNDVLPGTSINERRDDWRRDFYDRFIAVAQTAPDASAAVEKLNVAVFEAFGVRYHATKRPKPDQSPYESTRAGFASCTGLSILLIDACRAVGIPAWMVGTPRWTKQAGNHTWVEIWDREWKFVGACEPGKFNEGWFTDQAAAADESNANHRIYATSFGASSESFPMVWRPGNHDYPAEDVTRRYTLRRRVSFRLAGEAATAPSPPALVTIRQGGRIVAQDRLTPATTFELPGETDYEVVVQTDGQPASPPRTVHLSGEAGQVIAL